MRDGWIKVWRKIEDNPVLFDSIRYSLFVRLLNRAACYPCRVWFKDRWFDLQRGDALMSERDMAKLLSCDRQRIRTAIRVLKNAEMLTHNLTHGLTRISICNYDHYQRDYDGANPAPNPSPNPGLTQAQPTEKERERESYLPSSLPSVPSESENPQYASHTTPNGGNDVKREKRGNRMPDSWRPSEQAMEHCQSALGCGASKLQEIYESFYDWGQSVTGPKATKRDWDRAFINAVRTEMRRVREAEERDKRWRERFTVGVQR